MQLLNVTMTKIILVFYSTSKKFDSKVTLQIDPKNVQYNSTKKLYITKRKKQFFKRYEIKYI